MDFMENRLSKFENDIANQFGHNLFYNNVLYAYFIICWKNVLIRVFYFWWQRIVESWCIPYESDRFETKMT